ncbi:response regulator [Maridesulfovibrio hydrothermalis]|uniref:Anti-sigma-factor antagonist n=1 Tax=Maridesulfovibrio hydrothermalis AM13 = DSM 14728 TaxID=1121451 RepID=L0REX9_9BACT|nr:response regulator [Maridesulfovibrio hydrothermalis]CCO25338.1 Anti-sigma-factor antagonist [Maridesulfovibrio hydrothermalis AM13 = DSM 14728]
MSRILVIDDEKATLNMFKMLLNAYGHEVLTAENGETGIELFDAERPELVMTDIKMPGMDGLEVLNKIKEMSPDAEVIVITGHGDMDLAIKALNLDATDFLNKPVKREDLEKALNLSADRRAFALKKQDEVQLSLEEDLAVIKITGNLTSKSEGLLLDIFDEAVATAKSNFLLTFQEKASINGAAVDTLYKVVEKARTKGREVLIAGLSENFRAVLDSMGISQMASIHKTEQDARENLPK